MDFRSGGVVPAAKKVRRQVSGPWKDVRGLLRFRRYPDCYRELTSSLELEMG